MKGAVITWGRFQPPTASHVAMFNLMNSIAYDNQYDMKIFTSHTQDKDKNPLSYEDKIIFLRFSVPKKYRDSIIQSKSKTIFEVLEELRNEGYENVIMVVGGDRMEEFKVALKPYLKDMGFKSFMLQSAGERDPDSDDELEAMSASSLRKAAKDGDIKTFKNGLSDLLDEDQKNQLFKLVRNGMEIKK